MFWVLVAIPGVALATQQPAEPSETPAESFVPAHFPWVRTSWLQDLAERFANYIDVLSLQFSAILGGWSRQPLLFAITPAKIILLLVTLTIGFALAGVARVVILKYHALGRIRPITERYWQNGLLFALRRVLSSFFILTGAFFAVVPILPHLGLALGGYPTFAIAAKLAILGYFATALNFCSRVVRLVRQWLNEFVKRPTRRWYYGAFPVLGEALYYNLLLCAFSTVIFMLELPAPLQTAAFKIASIAWIVANTALLIRTMVAVESMLSSRSEMLQYDIYKRRQLETRVQILRRLLIFVFLVVAIAAILMNFK